MDVQPHSCVTNIRKDLLPRIWPSGRMLGEPGSSCLLDLLFLISYNEAHQLDFSMRLNLKQVRTCELTTKIA